MAKKPVQLDANGKRKFGMRDCLAYAAGDLGCNMSFALKGTMAIFWTQFMKLDLWYSLLLIVVQVWDAINDPLIGSIIDADKRQYKRNKFLSYIWFGSIGLIIGGACCFLPFPNAPTWAKMIIFIAGYVVWDAFYTIANVPYGSLLSLISKEPADRASLSAWRSVGSIAGNMLPMVILPFIIYDANNNLIGERVFLAALIMGALGFLCFQFMIRNTEIREEVEVQLDDVPKFNVIKAMGNFLKNRPAVGATLAAMGMFLGMNAANTATTIMFATYFNMASLSGVVQVIGFLPMLIFMPFITQIVNKYGKKEASVVGTLVSIAGGALMLVFPLVGSVNASLVVFMLGLCVFGFGMGIYTCVSWAMMADAIDYNEWKFGTREEGTVYSLHSFFRKLAQGVGPSIVLLLMGALGYVSSLGTIGQSAETAKNMCWLVAGLYMFSAVVQFIGLGLVYNLDKKSLTQMNEELAARKAAKD